MTAMNRRWLARASFALMFAAVVLVLAVAGCRSSLALVAFGVAPGSGCRTRRRSWAPRWRCCRARGPRMWPLARQAVADRSDLPGQPRLICVVSTAGYG